MARIAIVDDDKDGADTIAMLLRFNGHDVKAVYSGAAALTLAAEWKPDFILLDVTMPIMDGLQVTRKLREQEPRPVIVAISGHAREDDKLRAKEAGVDHYLVKPIDFEEVKALLGR
jgi:CheY-like chemotaxis protein